MPRIFLPEIIATAVSVTIRDEKARYLSAVLRCKAGDRLIITDAGGNSYSAKIIIAAKKEVTAEITGRHKADAESPLHITLLQGLLKGEKMDLVIQKATELGVNEIIPVITERSQVRETKKLQRWKKIAEEASRQSGRSVIPAVHGPVDFGGLFISYPVSCRGIVFWEEGGEGLSAAIKRFKGQDKIIMFTGPEGGFSEGEIKTASENGLIAASLGKRTLRAETAAIAALSVIQYELGDMGV